jgi:3-dehydroshikimate dehydratase
MALAPDSLLTAGLCSVTFRQHDAATVIDIAARAQLSVIEWGGDLHVPPGKPDLARDVHRLTVDRGLRCCSYGSYFNAVDPPDFAAVLDTALLLHAPTVRIWAGHGASDNTSPARRARTVDQLRSAADLAQSAGLRLGIEWHSHTLTDTARSAQQLIREIDHPAVGLYWQPQFEWPMDECTQSLRDAAPQLVNLHVFHWLSDYTRRPLSEGEPHWPAWLALARTRAAPVHALLEFVANDSPDQLYEDARTLHRWIRAGTGMDHSHAEDTETE